MATAAFQSVIPSIVPFPVPELFQSLLGRVLGIDAIGQIYEGLRSKDQGRSIAERLLESLAVTYTVSTPDLERVPRNGPVIVTVNHPFGILEGAVLAALLRQIRTDVRFLANGILSLVPEVRDLVIAVDPISGRSAAGRNGGALRRSLAHLESGGMLVIFPAGEVSHFRLRTLGVTDAEWNPAVARMVKIAARNGCKVPILPAYVAGANSALFQLAGVAHPGLRTALLGRELLNKRGRSVEVRLGSPVAPDKLLAIPTAREQAEYLRFKAKTSVPLVRRADTKEQEIAPAVSTEKLAAEIAGLPGENLLARSGDLEVYLAGAEEIPAALHEIGRLREITFRAAGEGTGKPLDIDAFDAGYLHLFVWNGRKQEIAGAYRLAAADRVSKLYTATLFEYGTAFLDRLGPAVELGRSFVRQEYQKAFAPLLLLWKGIGAYIARHPQYKVVFGAVSISNRYEAVSRELMVSFLEKYALLSEWSGLVRNRNGFRKRLLRGSRRPAFPASGLDVEELSNMVGDVEPGQAGVPVLLRQYLRLGGKLLGFNVDPKFADALDGLILVDLTRTEPKLLERYLGRSEAATFLKYQESINGTH
jgi:putative hemolysin